MTAINISLLRVIYFGEKFGLQFSKVNHITQSFQLSADETFHIPINFEFRLMNMGQYPDLSKVCLCFEHVIN